MDAYHLRVLYDILSFNLLDERDLARMGTYYREAPVYILKNGRLDMELEEGVYYLKIAELMEYYFAFFNAPTFSQTMTDQYVKSQILHFYFVYIHPYFDVNVWLYGIYLTLKPILILSLIEESVLREVIMIELFEKQNILAI